jgi:hypothetical protein
MGAKILGYFQYAAKKGGLSLQVKLAMKTGISQPQAAEKPDSPENLNKLYTVLRELTGNDPGVPRP